MKAEDKFIQLTGFLFEWEGCEGLLGCTEPNGYQPWITKEKLIEEHGDKAVEVAVELIEEGFTALPF